MWFCHGSLKELAYCCTLGSISSCYPVTIFPRKIQGRVLILKVVAVDGQAAPECEFKMVT